MKSSGLIDHHPYGEMLECISRMSFAEICVDHSRNATWSSGLVTAPDEDLWKLPPSLSLNLSLLFKRNLFCLTGE